VLYVKSHIYISCLFNDVTGNSDYGGQNGRISEQTVNHESDKKTEAIAAKSEVLSREVMANLSGELVHCPRSESDTSSCPHQHDIGYQCLSSRTGNSHTLVSRCVETICSLLRLQKEEKSLASTPACCYVIA
jgi:hypothetical protein